MTSGRKEFKDRVTVTGYLEKTEREALDEIRWREHASENEMIRKAIQEFINAHSAGNDSFKLDNWQDPKFKAVPSIMDVDKNKWYKHFMDLNPQDFFYLLRILNERKNQMIDVKNKRGITIRNA